MFVSGINELAAIFYKKKTFKINFMSENQEEIMRRLKEGEIQYVRSLLIQLKDKSKHTRDFWENKTTLCLEVAIKLLTRKDSDESIILDNWKTAKEILLAFLKIRPDVFEAVYYLAICHDFFQEVNERDKTYREILQWAMGDWNEALDCIKANNNGEAIENLNLCIQKLTFFISYVPEFFYAYKMRAKCYKMMRKKDQENSDMENYEFNYSKFGTQPELNWTKGYNLT